jgi:hypothetical protein
MAGGGFAESHQSFGKTYDGTESCHSQMPQRLAALVCEDQWNQTLMPLA